MKQSLTILLILFTVTAAGQNSDSLHIIYQDDNLIEIVKQAYPKLEKWKKGEAYTFSLPKDTISIEEQYGILKEGEIKVYNRFYQLTQYLRYRDSLLIQYDWYDNGIKESQQKFIQGDSIFSLTIYYPDGKPQHQEYISPDSCQRTEWYKNGNIIFHCTLTNIKEKTHQEDCYYWDDQGYFESGERRLLQVKNEFMGPESVEEFELDKSGNIIK